MAAPKRFQTLVELQQQEGEPFEVVGNLSQLPKWFHSEYLKSPKTVHLEAWLVEEMFGLDGEHIPHVECVTHTLLHVTQWDPEGEAEILVFGRPYYQQDVSEMIMGLADHFRRLRVQNSEKAPAQEADTQQFPEATQEAGTQHSPPEVREAGTQRSLSEVPEAGTQQSSDLDQEAGTQSPPEAACEPVTRL